MRDRNREFRRVPLSDLMANPANWRRHGGEQRRALRAVLEGVGFVGSLLAFEGPGGLTLIDGHLRQEELEGLDPDFLVPVAVTDLTEEEANKVLATYDPIGAMAEADKDVLASLLISMRDQDEGLDDLLESIARQNRVVLPIPEAQTDPDAVPEAVEEPYVQRGDLWLLGEHRLLCGDAMVAEDVERLMGGASLGIVIADPPYGMRLDTDYSSMKSNLRFMADKAARGGRRYEGVVGDDADFDASPIRGLWVAPEQFWFGADYYANSLGTTEHEGSWLVWDKRLDESADLMFGSCFELIWSALRHKRVMLRHKWAGIFGSEREDMSRRHPTQKPVVLIADIVARWGGGAVADPFVGSGTSIIAAERLGQRCYAMEIEPRYVQVAIERWQNYTGNQAELIERR